MQAEDVQQRNRRRRYSLSSPHLFESRAHSSNNPPISLPTDQLFPVEDANMEKYDLLSRLSVGTFGGTYLIRDSNDGQMYILKRMSQSLPEHFRQRLFNERRLLGSCKSHYLLSLISSYVDVKHHCFTMKFEYVHGLTLYHLVRRVRRFEESAVAFYAAQIVLAFEYLHELNIIYVRQSAIVVEEEGTSLLEKFEIRNHSSY
jgi:serine/threonine protein kinase